MGGNADDESVLGIVRENIVSLGVRDHGRPENAAGGNRHGLRDESSEGNMGGGPQFSKWHSRSGSMTRNDESTHNDNETGSDEGHGVMGEGAMDGQTNSLKGMFSRI